MSPEACVGKTIKSVSRGKNDENEYGREEPTITFTFTDETEITIVMPSND